MKNTKNIVLSLLGCALVGTSGFGFYKTNEMAKDVNDLKKETQTLKKENDSLSKENKKISDDSKKTASKLKETEKKLKEANDNEIPVNKVEQQSVQSSPLDGVPANSDRISPEENQRMNDLAKQEQERLAKEEAEKKAKENEPQYAVYDGQGISRFGIEYSFTVSEFYELNPGVDNPVKGETYRVK